MSCCNFYVNFLAQFFTRASRRMKISDLDFIGHPNQSLGCRESLQNDYHLLLALVDFFRLRRNFMGTENNNSYMKRLSVASLLNCANCEKPAHHKVSHPIKMTGWLAGSNPWLMCRTVSWAKSHKINQTIV